MTSILDFFHMAPYDWIGLVIFIGFLIFLGIRSIVFYIQDVIWEWRRK